MIPVTCYGNRFLNRCFTVSYHQRLIKSPLKTEKKGTLSQCLIPMLFLALNNPEKLFHHSDWKRRLKNEFLYSFLAELELNIVDSIVFELDGAPAEYWKYAQHLDKALPQFTENDKNARSISQIHAVITELTEEMNNNGDQEYFPFSCKFHERLNSAAYEDPPYYAELSSATLIEQAEAVHQNYNLIAEDLVAIREILELRYAYTLKAHEVKFQQQCGAPRFSRAVEEAMKKDHETLSNRFDDDTSICLGVLTETIHRGVYDSHAIRFFCEAVTRALDSMGKLERLYEIVFEQPFTHSEQLREFLIPIFDEMEVLAGIEEVEE